MIEGMQICGTFMLVWAFGLIILYAIAQFIIGMFGGD